MKNNKIEKFSFAEVFGEGSCEKEIVLFRYFEKKLSPEEQKDFEIHLANCDKCPRMLSMLQQEEKVLESDLDPARAREQFEKNRTRLRAHLDVKFSDTHQTTPPSRKTSRLPAYMNFLMLLVIAGLLYPAYRSFILDQRVTEVASQLESERSKRRLAEESLKNLSPETKDTAEPMLTSPTIYSARPERAEKDKTITVNFDRENPVQNLVFALPPGKQQDYSVVITRDSQTVWQKQVHVNTESPLISLSLPASYFQPGNYLLTISRDPSWNYEVNLQVNLR